MSRATSPLHARPQVSLVGEGGRHRNAAEVVGGRLYRVQQKGRLPGQVRGDRDREVCWAASHRAFAAMVRVTTGHCGQRGKGLAPNPHALAPSAPFSLYPHSLPGRQWPPPGPATSAFPPALAPRHAGNNLLSRKLGPGSSIWGLPLLSEAAPPSRKSPLTLALRSSYSQSAVT